MPVGLRVILARWTQRVCVLDEQHVDAAQRDRVDAEEIAREEAPPLGMQKLAPARPVTARGWPQAGAE
jgi:hypothetical protein